MAPWQGGIIGLGKNQAARLNSSADSLVIRYRCIEPDLLEEKGKTTKGEGGGGRKRDPRVGNGREEEGRLAPRRHRIGRAWRKYARHIARSPTVRLIRSRLPWDVATRAKALFVAHRFRGIEKKEIRRNCGFFKLNGKSSGFWSPSQSLGEWSYEVVT